MEIEQLEREPRLRKNLALDSTLRADKKWLDSPILLYHRARDGESRIKVAASSSTRE
jgi:hypothetical protein